jgi:hypothetical protein
VIGDQGGIGIRVTEKVCIVHSEIALGRWNLSNDGTWKGPAAFLESVEDVESQEATEKRVPCSLFNDGIQDGCALVG